MSETAISTAGLTRLQHQHTAALAAAAAVTGRAAERPTISNAAKLAEIRDMVESFRLRRKSTMVIGLNEFAALEAADWLLAELDRMMA